MVWRNSPMTTIWKRSLLFVTFGCVLAGSVTARPEILDSTAEMSWVATNPGYHYTITLGNSAESTVPIQTFWFGWLAGNGNFLTSSPFDVEEPLGWSFRVTNDGPTDGFGIRFITTNAPINPNFVLQFAFDSLDSPKAMSSKSPYYSDFFATSSQIYSGRQVGIRRDLLVSVVPEPKALGLASIGLLCLLAYRFCFARVEQ